MGDKVINNPKIPKILLNTNKKGVISAFLNQAFSDDGSVYISGKHKQGALTFGQSIDISNLNKKFIKKIKKERLTNYASNVVNGCKIMLEKLEIKVNGPYPKLPYIRNKGGKKRMVMSWVIQIQGRKNIQIYKDLVGFSIPRKNKKINKILKNYKYVDYGKSFETSYNVVKILNKDKIIIQLDNFVKKRRCTRDYARQLLKNLRKEGIIERSGGGINKGIWGCTPYEYKLINK